MVVYSQTLNCLPVILEEDMSLIHTAGNEIIETLSFDYLKTWHVKKTLEAEANFLTSFEQNLSESFKRIYADNFAKNTYFEASKDILNMSLLPWHKIENTASQLEEEYACSLYRIHNCMVYGLVLNTWFYHFEEYGRMFINAHRLTAKQYALIIWIKAHMGNIPVDNMSHFVESEAAQYYGPGNPSPLKWDATRSAIYQDTLNIENQRRQYLVYYK